MNAHTDEADELDAALMGNPAPHTAYGHSSGMRAARFDGEEGGGGSYDSVDDDEFFDVGGLAAGQGASDLFSLPATLH